MLYYTSEFAVFFAVVFVLYWFVLDHNLDAQNRLLLFASYVFYAAWDWRFLGLVIFSSLADFFLGGWLFRTSDNRRKRLLLLTSLAVNLGVLGFFKYFGFFVESFQALMGRFGYYPPDWTLRIILPVGISFYTFQSLSYTIDIYRGDLRPVKKPLNFLKN